MGIETSRSCLIAVDRARLAAIVESWPAGLDTLLQEGGAPLSAGQRQLLALARAQLNPSRILVLDEATANVDVETDAVIQRTMRAEFKDRTILAIAHRLHTVIDYDKVLVLDKGLVAEFGTPKDLLAAPEGIFTSMVDDTGRRRIEVFGR
jgi:ABC-type multidrug transport system fused ATPase/permease subunit